MQAVISRSVVRGGALLLAMVLPLGFAGAQDACKINDGGEFQLTGARNYITMAANPKYPSEVPKYLANSIKILSERPEKIKNQAGRHYLLLRTYAQWMAQDVGYTVRRGDIGFTDNPNGMHNMLLAIDSSYNAIVSMLPECKTTVSPYLDRFVTEVFNKAVTALQDEQLDSAVYYSRLAMDIMPTDPRPWNVMASVYQSKEPPDMDSARIAMRKVIELAGSDTLYTAIAQQHRYNMAIMAIETASKDGPNKDASMKEARSLLEAFLKVEPGEPRASQALGRVFTMSGDTAAVTALYRDMTSNPDRFTDMQLFEAASGAAAVERDAEAALLFDAGLRKNPNHLLGLINAANVYFNLRQADKMGPLAKRLLEIDPNSRDAHQIYAGYWQIRQREETDSLKRREYADSTLAAITARDDLNPQVQIMRSGKAGENYAVEGVVLNISDKEASYTMKFEFLDATGKVVDTKDVPVGPIAGSSSVSFNVMVAAPDAVAFRYAKLQ